MFLMFSESREVSTPQLLISVCEACSRNLGLHMPHMLLCVHIPVCTCLCTCMGCQRLGEPCSCICLISQGKGLDVYFQSWTWACHCLGRELAIAARILFIACSVGVPHQPEKGVLCPTFGEEATLNGAEGLAQQMGGKQRAG